MLPLRLLFATVELASSGHFNVGPPCCLGTKWISVVSKQNQERAFEYAVKNYMSRILKRLDAENRSEAVETMFECGSV